MKQWIALAGAALALAGCGQADMDRRSMPGADAGRGREIIASVGCGACHTIPGIGWPKGRVGPSLEGFSSRALIAGRSPNNPETLVGFVRNAQAYAPGIAMPPMPLSEREARDIAAYLYTL